MTSKAYLITFLVMAGSFTLLCAEGGYDAIILFKSAPNPTGDKCLIRTYLPELDANSSIRILDKDSTLVKEIPLTGEVGISSTPINVSDWNAGTYFYQLFYKGEARSTYSFVVKH